LGGNLELASATLLRTPARAHGSASQKLAYREAFAGYALRGGRFDRNRVCGERTNAITGPVWCRALSVLMKATAQSR